MLVWINRFKVEKGDGHITWIDLYQDKETNVQYFGTQNGLTVRYNEKGLPCIGFPIID